MTATLSEGDNAPPFDLPAEGGESVSLASLKGRTVVVFFYPKDDTSGCTKEAIAFSGLKKKFEAAGATIVGVSPDSIASHARFSQKHNLNVTLLSDPEKEMLQAYGVWTEKSMYGRKYMGVERSTFLISPKGMITHIWRKVRPSGHAEAVLAAVGSSG